MKRYLLAALLLLFTFPVFGRGKLDGWVERGGQQVTINNGLKSVERFQRSYPSSTVTVYLTGTTTLATLYSDSAGTTKSNPFTADFTGYYSFYADDGCYDLRFTGTTAYTLSDVCTPGSQTTAVTQPPGTNTTQIATTAFVQAAIPIVRVREYVTSGSGTSADPWLGWEAAVTNAPEGAQVYFQGNADGGYYKTTSTSVLDLQGRTLHLYGDGGRTGRTVIWGVHTGDAVISLAGTNNCTIRRIRIIGGDTVTNPKTGLLMGRRPDAGSYGRHILEDVYVLGSFTKANIYEIASEENIFTQVMAHVPLGAPQMYGWYLSQADDLAVGSLSSSTHSSNLYFRCGTVSFKEDAGFVGIYFNVNTNTTNHTWVGSYNSIADGTALQINKAVIAANQGVIQFIDFGAEGTGGTTSPDAAIKLTATSAGSTLSGFTLKGGFISTGYAAGITQHANVITNDCEFDIQAVTPAHSFIPGQMINTIVRTGGDGNYAVQGTFKVREFGLVPRLVAVVNGANNDLNPGARSTLIEITGASAPFTIGGFSGGREGRVLTLLNLTGQTMTINHADVGSATANRINCKGGVNVSVGASGSVSMVYSTTNSRWYVTAVN